MARLRIRQECSWCTNTIQLDLPTLNRIAEFLYVDIKDLICSNKEI